CSTSVRSSVSSYSHRALSYVFAFFFLTAPATPDISPLSLHDALPICWFTVRAARRVTETGTVYAVDINPEAIRYITHRSGEEHRSEEHTSELQSLTNLVCRLLLEKKTQRLPLNGRSQARTSRITDSRS